jgi:hypothetical protein
MDGEGGGKPNKSERKSRGKQRSTPNKSSGISSSSLKPNSNSSLNSSGINTSNNNININISNNNLNSNLHTLNNITLNSTINEESTITSSNDRDRSFSNHRSVATTIQRDATLGKGKGSRMGGSGNQQQQQQGSGNQQGTKDGDVSTHTAVSSSAHALETVLDIIPPEYLYDPNSAEPSLHYLPKVVASSQHNQLHSKTTTNAGKFPNLRMLLAAAEDDIRLHRARQQAGRHGHIDYLRTYKLETDPLWLARQQRLNERVLVLSKLDTERTIIFNELQADIKGLTAQEKTQVQLARWQRALELFVYAPPKNTSNMDEAASATTGSASLSASSSGLPPVNTFGKSSELDLWGLLEKLLEGISEVRLLLCCDVIVGVMCCGSSSDILTPLYLSIPVPLYLLLYLL